MTRNGGFVHLVVLGGYAMARGIGREQEEISDWAGVGWIRTSMSTSTGTGELQPECHTLSKARKNIGGGGGEDRGGELSAFQLMDTRIFVIESEYERVTSCKSPCAPEAGMNPIHFVWCLSACGQTTVLPDYAGC